MKRMIIQILMTISRPVAISRPKTAKLNVLKVVVLTNLHRVIQQAAKLEEEINLLKVRLLLLLVQVLLLPLVPLLLLAPLLPLVQLILRTTCNRS